MTITIDTIRQSGLAGNLTDDQLAAALAQVDQDAVLIAARSRWTSEVWDRTSPINGVRAEHFLARDDVSDAAVYLLLQDGVVVYFQPHVPHTPGFGEMDHHTVEEHAAAHLEEVAQHDADVQVLTQVLATP